MRDDPWHPYESEDEEAPKESKNQKKKRQRREAAEKEAFPLKDPPDQDPDDGGSPGGGTEPVKKGGAVKGAWVQIKTEPHEEEGEIQEEKRQRKRQTAEGESRETLKKMNLNNQELKEHVMGGHLEYYARCEACRKGSIRNRPHTRTTDEKKESQIGTLTADLSGPHVISGDRNRYLLVMVRKRKERKRRKKKDKRKVLK